MAERRCEWFAAQKERIAADCITRFYKRWQKLGWSSTHASSAFRDMKRKVEYWVGPERSKEMLP
jgi:hypothetical protein